MLVIARNAERDATNARRRSDALLPTISAFPFGDASTIGCKEPVGVNELGGFSALEFDATLPQLNNENFARRFAKIRGRRAHEFCGLACLK